MAAAVPRQQLLQAPERSHQNAPESGTVPAFSLLPFETPTRSNRELLGGRAVDVVILRLPI